MEEVLDKVEVEEVEEGPPHASQQLKKVRRPLSAWMIFCNENRALIKEANPEYGFKDIARALSEGFKSLTEEEKIPFETKASADKERYTREMKEYLENSKSLTPLGETPSRTSLPHEIIFPLARIKKTMKFDPNVRNIQKEALVAVSKATELFIAYLSVRSSQVAMRNKRRTVKEIDLVEAIHTSELLTFLHSDFPKTNNLNQKRKEIDVSHPSEEKEVKIDTSNRTINSFFSSRARK